MTGRWRLGYLEKCSAVYRVCDSMWSTAIRVLACMPQRGLLWLVDVGCQWCQEALQINRCTVLPGDFLHLLASC